MTTTTTNSARYAPQTGAVCGGNAGRCRRDKIMAKVVVIEGEILAVSLCSAHQQEWDREMREARAARAR